MSRPDMLHAPGGSEAVEVGSSLHLREDSAMSAQLHPGEGRVVVALGEWPHAARIDLYLRRAVLLRLRDFLDDTLAALDGVTDGATDPDPDAGTASTASTSRTSTGTEHDTAA